LGKNSQKITENLGRQEWGLSEFWSTKILRKEFLGLEGFRHGYK
jgi:hypothetical protein